MHLVNKERKLKKITSEIVNCGLCQLDSIGVAVPGEGNADAKIVFVGEAPGKQEAKAGRPFIGRSGKLLRAEMQSIGLKENEVFIVSPVKYLPEKGTPSKQQIIHARSHFLKQMAIIKPKIMVLMGKVAAWGALDREVAVAKMHGQHIEENGIIYFFMYHPAAAIRFSKFRQTFTNDFSTLKSLINNSLTR